jgi:lipopolysaccharide export system protein LptC
VAAPRISRLRVPLALVAVALLSWIVYQTVHAGSEIPPPPAQQQTTLSGGSANDKRVDGKSWSLDYDTATLSPDGSVATIDHVHDGVILREGKPYMRLKADHVTANLTLNDFVVLGKVTFTEIAGQHRTFETDGAHYSGASHTLQLDKPTTISDPAMTFHVATASVNFATGETKLGRINGRM